MGDAKYKLFKNSDSRFFSFSFLGDIGDLGQLLSIETTSETYWALEFALLKLIEVTNEKGYIFPRLKGLLSDLAAAPYNALTKSLNVQILILN